MTDESPLIFEEPKNLQELIAQWNTGEGKPFKNKLIDYPDDGQITPGCMCAQGQVLFYLKKETAKTLKYLDQTDADRQVAKFLNISIGHSILLRRINDRLDGAPAIVLTDPGKILGPHWSKILDAMWFMQDSSSSLCDLAMKGNVDQLDRDRTTVKWHKAVDNIRLAMEEYCWMYDAFDQDSPILGITDPHQRHLMREMTCADILKKNGHELYFHNLLGWKSPADVPARPENYGLGTVPAA